MNVSKLCAPAAMLAVLASILLAGCEATPKDYREYKNKETSYYKGDSCDERYQLYDDGTYERYIYGTYMGRELKSMMRGTLFETGTYEEVGKPAEVGGGDGNEDEETDAAEETVSDEPWEITFTSLKQYDFDTERLEGLGTERETRTGTISDTKLTVKYRVWYDNEYYPGLGIGHYEPVTWTYTRNW